MEEEGEEKEEEEMVHGGGECYSRISLFTISKDSTRAKRFNHSHQFWSQHCNLETDCFHIFHALSFYGNNLKYIYTMNRLDPLRQVASRHAEAPSTETRTSWYFNSNFTT